MLFTRVLVRLLGQRPARPRRLVLSLRSVLPALLSLAVGLGLRSPVGAQVLDELLDLGDEVEGPPRLRFSGMADLRYLDGGGAITPSSVNNQGASGGIASFAASRVHLFTDARIGDSSSLFVHVSGGASDQRRTALDALALTTRLGPDLPTLEIGRILNDFGRFPTRFLPHDNPLVGLPLIYGYRTSLQPGQVPANPVDLLGQAGRGQASRFAGYGGAGSGLRPVSNSWYVNGIRLRHDHGTVRWSLTAHNEAIGNAQPLDGQDGKTVTGHLRYRPTPSLDMGLSYSTGAYLDAGVFSNPAASGLDLGDFRQEAMGFDLNVTRGHFQLFAELVKTRWDSPFIPDTLEALGMFIEPRYRFRPGLTLVARVGRLDFMNIQAAGGVSPWDLDVNRVEVGLVHALDRDVNLKISHQFNRTQVPGGTDPDDDLLQVQATAVF